MMQMVQIVIFHVQNQNNGHLSEFNLRFNDLKTTEYTYVHKSKLNSRLKGSHTLQMIMV